MLSPIQSLDELADAEKLLRRCDLPVSDISSSQAMVFFGIRSETDLAAVVGLEIHGSDALLRSLAVDPAFRGRGLGHGLVGFAESYAAQQGVTHLYLLTTTASEFFLRLGYSPLARADAPPAIQATQQFAGLCPESSAFLGKLLADPASSENILPPHIAEAIKYRRMDKER